MSDENYNAVPPPDSLKPSVPATDISAAIEKAKAVAAKYGAKNPSMSSDPNSQTAGKRTFDEVSDNNSNSQSDHINNRDYNSYNSNDADRSNKRLDMGSNKGSSHLNPSLSLSPPFHLYLFSMHHFFFELGYSGYNSDAPQSTQNQDSNNSWNNNNSYQNPAKDRFQDSYQSPHLDQSGAPGGDAYKNVGLYSSAGASSTQAQSDILTETMDIPAEVVGLLIGKGGETIKLMQSQSNCRIYFNQELKSESNTKSLIMSGPPQAIALARNIVEERLSQSSFIRNAAAANDPRMSLFKGGVPRATRPSYPNMQYGNRGNYPSPNYQQGYNPNQQQQQYNMPNYGQQSSGYPKRPQYNSNQQGYQQQNSGYGGYNQPPYGAQQGYGYQQQNYSQPQSYDPSQAAQHTGASQPQTDAPPSSATNPTDGQSNEAYYAAYYSQMGYQNYPGYGAAQQGTAPGTAPASASTPASQTAAASSTNTSAQASTDPNSQAQWTNTQYATYYAQYAASYPEYAQYAEYYRQLAASDPNGFPPTAATAASTTDATKDSSASATATATASTAADQVQTSENSSDPSSNAKSPNTENNTHDQQNTSSEDQSANKPTDTSDDAPKTPSVTNNSEQPQS
ncbi:hypothetical protein AYI70_g2130 [Smittium culicis]|uniref:K Homology domain-containing protein n=1 Tax=Smittium culicis TaxID=133412 RepID=A0A1R1Y9M8_9FUNG|nr:hypothetical protein AYI70_g2130 [Smittium culicis]